MNTMRITRRRRRLVLAGAVATTYVGTKAVLGTWPRAERDFFRRTGPPTDSLELPSGDVVDLPALYFREDSFMGVFSAAREPVEALLPSDRLHPVRVPGGRVAVAVFAFNYIDRNFDPPYGEVAVTPLCTYDRDVPGALALLLEGRLPGFGAFVLHLPVTARNPRDGGRIGWGYAKFVADMDFTRRPDYQSVHLAEGGAHILTLTVKQRGLPMRDNRPLVTYSVLNGDLIRTTVPSRAVYQLGMQPGNGTLELGDHRIADQLRQLDLSRQPLITKNYLSRSGILPLGENLGPADRPHLGYEGTDREYGRLTISYEPLVEPVDVYARLRATATAR